MKRFAVSVSLLAIAAAATAQSLPPGPKITISAITQLSPTLPQS